LCLSGTICSVFLVPSPRRVSLPSSQKVRRNPPEPCAGIRRGGGKYSGGVFRPKGGVASLQNQKWLPSQARIYLRWSKRAPSPRALLRSSVGGFGFISSAFVRLRFVTDGPARCAAKKRPRTGRGRSPPGRNPPPPCPPHDNPGQRPRAKSARNVLDALGRTRAREPCAGAPRLRVEKPSITRWPCQGQPENRRPPGLAARDTGVKINPAAILESSFLSDSRKSSPVASPSGLRPGAVQTAWARPSGLPLRKPSRRSASCGLTLPGSRPSFSPGENLPGRAHDDGSPTPGIAQTAHPRAIGATGSPSAPTPRDGQKTRRRWGNPLLTGVYL